MAGWELWHRGHAAADHPEGVHVEPRVGLVQHGQLWFEEGHLKDLVALALAAGEPLVEVPLTERGVHPSRSIHSVIAKRTSRTDRSMPLRADMAWRRNWVTDTPLRASGYWKAKNRPAFALTSVGQEVTSSPLSLIASPVTR